MNNQEFFVVSRVSRDDLVTMGYAVEHISDDAMRMIATKMGDGINESGAFWDALGNVCDGLGMEKTIK